LRNPIQFHDINDLKPHAIFFTPKSLQQPAQARELRVEMHWGNLMYNFAFKWKAGEFNNTRSRTKVINIKASWYRAALDMMQHHTSKATERLSGGTPQFSPAKISSDS